MRVYLAEIDIGHGVMQAAIIKAENFTNASLKLERYMADDVKRPNLSLNNVINMREIKEPVTMIQ